MEAYAAQDRVRYAAVYSHSRGLFCDDDERQRPPAIGSHASQIAVFGLSVNLIACAERFAHRLEYDDTTHNGAGLSRSGPVSPC